MRPIYRGDPPIKNGQEVAFSDPKVARDPLVDRLGSYCSYCEMPCPAGPEVEHIAPQTSNPKLATNWGNFLISCRYCNSIKGKTNVSTEMYIWPDRDNTFRAFLYHRDRSPQISSQLDQDVAAMAVKTLELTGLDREPGHPKITKRDTRWRMRREAWEKALHARHTLMRTTNQNTRELVLNLAKSTGFWSIWMTVFDADQEMRRELILHFPGTCTQCFDFETRAIKRPGGKC